MALIADLILALHFGIALFITLGLALIPLEFMYSWHWIRNRRFRQIHAGLMIFVAIEAVFAITCPLTVLEAQLRQTTAPIILGLSDQSIALLGFATCILLGALPTL